MAHTIFFQKKFVIAFVVLLPTTLQAQYINNMNTYIPTNVYIPPGIDYNGITQEESSSNSQRIERVVPVNLRFTLNAAQRSKNMKNFIAETAKVAPDFAVQLEKQLAEEDMFGQYGKLMSGAGLDSNNVADNFAAWWITAWEASSGRDVASADIYSVVQKQVKTMLTNADMAALSNADKQKMSDDLIIRTILLARQAEQGKSDAAYGKQLAIEIRKSTKASGLDLDAMTLTPEGFRAKGKKRGDANDAGADMPSAVPSSQLAADAAANTKPSGADADGTGEGWSAGTMALIAAAGGIGAAGVFAMGKASGNKKG